MNGRSIRECLGHIGSQYAGADSIALAFISQRDVINVEIVAVSLVIGSDDKAQEHTPGTLSRTENHDAGFVISAIPRILKVRFRLLGPVIHKEFVDLELIFLGERRGSILHC